jgi:hypothetical protein
MPTCYQCVTVKNATLEGIGVCYVCRCLACANHGGLPKNRPSFHCSRCVTGLIVQSAGGPPPPPSGPGTGGSGVPATRPPSPGTGGGVGQAFTSSLDFELQMPAVAQASVEERRRINLDAVREAVRRLFGLLRDEEPSREEFLSRIEGEVTEAIRDEILRQIRQRDNAFDYWQARGGVDAGAITERNAIISRFRSWLADDLEPWMAAIYPVLNENVWVGARDEPAGVVDVLLLADAIGLYAYNWNLDVERSPFRRLDVIAASDTALVVLAELYSESIGAYA